MKYYRRFPGDYLRDTLHLTMTQDGAYGRLLDAHYASERPLPIERSTLYAIARANTDEDRAAVEFVISQFFLKTRYGFVNRRAKKEFLRTKEISTKRANAGKQRGKRSANAEQLHPNPDSRLQTPDKYKETSKSLTPAKAAGGYPEFEIFYAAYPHERQIARGEARKAWIAQRLEGRLGEVLAGLAAWKTTEQWSDPKYIPYPQKFINKGYWRDSPQPVERKAEPDAKHESFTERNQRRSRQEIAEMRGSLDPVVSEVARGVPKLPN